MRVHDLLDDGGSRQPALLSPGERPVTYEELRGRLGELAARLGSIGVEEGSRVALVLPNGPEFVEILLALTSLGAVAAPLNPAYTRSEYAFYLGDVDPAFLLVPAGEQRAARDAAGAARIVDVAAVDGTIELDPSTGTRASSGAGSAGPDGAALLLHTSGTTARPKQVPLLHRNLVASARQTAAWYALTADDVSCCAMPLFHVHGLVASVLAALAAGGTVVVPRRLSPRRFAADVVRHGVTWFSAAPTILGRLLDGIAASPSGGGMRLRFVRTCSAPLPPALAARAEDELGVPVLEAYGMTEASHQISSNPLPPGRRVPGSVGLATGTEIRLVDGEVVIRGPGVMPGYLGDGDENAAGFVDGWFRTGDLGVVEDGYLRLTGRSKEMILRGGENVSPYEIEHVLLGHPAVEDAVCFGIPSPKYGEEVAAAVRCRADVSTRELAAHCREHLAAYKVPSEIRIVPELPRTATGKLQRARMAALLAGTVA